MIQKFRSFIKSIQLRYLFISPEEYRDFVHRFQDEIILTKDGEKLTLTIRGISITKQHNKIQSSFKIKPFHCRETYFDIAYSTWLINSMKGNSNGTEI